MSGHPSPPPVSQPNSPANTKQPLSDATTATSFSYFLCFAVLYRKLLKHKPTTTTPADLNHPRRFSYSVLRRATSSFSASNLLGQGGFGSVFRGVLPSGLEIAVKLMDSVSLQGEREFQNELSFSEKIDSDHIVSLIGFSHDSKKHGQRNKLVLVYELMHNGSLQDALLNRKCPELMDWKKRFEIAVDVAKGLEFLHFGCNPPVIHGDVKPSNVLLDQNFNAKIADFGLARVKHEEDCEAAVLVEIEPKGGQIGSDCNEDNKKNEEEDAKFLKEETASVTSSSSNSSLEEQSPESFMKVLDSEASPEIVKIEVDQLGMMGNKNIAKTQKNFDEMSTNNGGHERLKGSDQPERVKEYVMEWILTEIKEKEKKSDQVARKWWREEFYEELAKKKKNMKKEIELNSDDWWKDYEDQDLEHKKKKKIKEKKKKKSQRRSSWGSIEWWLDGFSGELWASNVTSKSSVSSNLSMRGTVCYTAPEYGSCVADQKQQLSEKCDVYSYGVLLLVLVSGRRPLQVTLSSPKSELESANLISWARHLAYKGKLVDLVDPNIQCLNREHAVLCIKVALLCLQRLASKRPTIREVLGMLSGKFDLPRKRSS